MQHMFGHSISMTDRFPFQRQKLPLRQGLQVLLARMEDCAHLLNSLCVVICLDNCSFSAVLQEV